MEEYGKLVHAEITGRIKDAHDAWITKEEMAAARRALKTAGAAQKVVRALRERERNRSNDRRSAQAVKNAALKGLNKEQVRAVVMDALRCRVIAGAGTGKTHTMVAKAKRWVREGIKANEIAFVTFTRKAAREIAERTPGMEAMTVGTIHHLAIEVVRRLAGQNIPVSDWAVNDGKRLKMMGAWLAQEVEEETPIAEDLEIMTMGESDVEEILVGSAQSADEWIRTIRRSVTGEEPNPAIAGEGNRVEDALVRVAKKLREKYESALVAQGTTDYEGLIALARGTIAKHKEKTAPWSRLIVDEWQDVNAAQSALIHALSAMRDSNGEQTRLTVVGDDWQSIFGFQGGEVDLLRTFEDPSGAKSAHCETVALAQTYRFGQALADTTRAFVTRKGAGDDKEVRGAPEGTYDPKAPAPIQMASTVPREPKATDGAGSTRAVCETLEYIAGDETMRSVLILARERRIYADRRGNIDERAKRLMKEWAKHPNRLPRHLVGRNTKKTERSAYMMAANPEGMDHKIVDTLAEELGIEVERSTIHGAKGREADCVILLDAQRSSAQSEGRLKIARDLAGAKERAQGEERRLWYVALTRARRTAYILVPPDRVPHSDFADEMWRGDDPRYDVGENALTHVLMPMSPMQPCPSCNNEGGRLVVKGERNDFVGCTGWRRDGSGCNHTERRCHECNIGVMGRATQSGTARCLNSECRAEAPLCACKPPRAMVVRENRRTGEEFWGCQRYGAEGACGITLPKPKKRQMTNEKRQRTNRPHVQQGIMRSGR